MAEPLLDLCPHCGAHFTPRNAILERLRQLERELKASHEDADELKDQIVEAYEYLED